MAGPPDFSYVDAHFHIWDLEANYYPWLTDRIVPDHVAGDYAGIRKSYLLSDYFADIEGTPVAKGVHIQAEHDPSDPVRETRWLQGVADRPESRGFPHAIVAHARLEAADAEACLAAHCAFANTRGIRQILPADMLENTVFIRNVGLLDRFGLSFDLRLRHPQMAAAARLAADHPDVAFIVTHLGYPLSRDPDYVAAWRAGMRELAAVENVAVKLSGFGFIDPDWTTDSLRPLILETIDLFGPDRALFASDFPVDGLSRDCRSFWAAYEAIVADFSRDERRAMFAGNAERLYRI